MADIDPIRDSSLDDRGSRHMDARTAGVERRHRSWWGWIIALVLLAIAAMWLLSVRNDRDAPQTVGTGGHGQQLSALELTGIPGVL